jgi:alkaline phosphatase D
VVNNYLGETVPGGRVANARVPERRAAAYKAWWENIPTRLPAPEDDHADIYRDLVVGDLARITLLDERQYADVAPCRDVVEDDFGDCRERQRDRTRLGDAQESFVASALTRADTTWNLVGNPVVLAGIDAGRTEPEFYLDTWDGYPDAQRRMITSLAAAQNPVVLTGDYHAGMLIDVHERPFEPDSPLVATEPSTSSTTWPTRPAPSPPGSPAPSRPGPPAPSWSRGRRGCRRATGRGRGRRRGGRRRPRGPGAGRRTGAARRDRGRRAGAWRSPATGGSSRRRP